MSYYEIADKKLSYNDILYMKKEEKDEIRTKFLKNNQGNFTLKELEFLTLLNVPSFEIPNIG